MCPLCDIAKPGLSCSCVEAASSAKRQDEKWFADHPDEVERTRPLSLEEQVRRFIHDGAAVTHKPLIRARQENVEKGRVVRYESILTGDCW